MKILFCQNDFNDRIADQHFAKEFQSALACDLAIGLIDFNAIRRRDKVELLRQLVPSLCDEKAIYRGWMLTPGEYEFLYSSLHQFEISLITTPEQYVHCHWFPRSYSIIRDATPRTVWVPSPDCFDIEKNMAAIRRFSGAPLIVKDYVKSRKHEWNQACFIPDSSNEATVARVTRRFLELQDDDLQGGLVYREFVELQHVGTHPKSGMPLTLEYRLFVCNRNVISVCPYWDAEYVSDIPPIASFEAVLSRVESPFFSCDIAKRISGEWTIVELGDGQVAGLPERCDVSGFYRQLTEQSTLFAASSMK